MKIKIKFVNGAWQVYALLKSGRTKSGKIIHRWKKVICDLAYADAFFFVKYADDLTPRFINDYALNI